MKHTISAFDKALCKAVKEKKVKMKLTVGTRGSVLALAQTNIVLKQIKQAHPDVEFKVNIIKTMATKNKANHCSLLIVKVFLKKKSTNK